MSDLNFVPSEDMIKELQSRYDEMVFLGSSKRTKETEDITVCFTGSYHACVGLIELGRMAVQSGGSGDEDDSD
jgi:hypothetical protein